MNLYKAWKPFQDIPAPLYLESMVKDGSGLRLVLQTGSEDGRRLRIHFKDVLAFRSANEKCLLKTWEDNESWEGHSSLLIVTDSEFVEWLHAQSFGMFADRPITHYALYTPDDCLDILSDQAPEVGWDTLPRKLSHLMPSNPPKIKSNPDPKEAPNMHNRKFDVEREVLTHNYLYKTASHCFEQATEEETASFYFLMASLVFSAFSLEAYLNHIGAIIFPFWEEVEQIKTKSKLKLLYKEAQLEYDPSRKPIQKALDLIRFRNEMAHGRTEKISGSGEVPPDKIKSTHTLIQTKWESFCTKENAAQGLEDVKAIMEMLHKAHKLEGRPLGSLGSGSGTIEPA